jgi:hypothetical protein
VQQVQVDVGVLTVVLVLMQTALVWQEEQPPWVQAQPLASMRQSRASSSVCFSGTNLRNHAYYEALFLNIVGLDGVRIGQDLACGR